MTITEFLLARIAEDEADALASSGDQRWEANPVNESFAQVVSSDGGVTNGVLQTPDAVHVARWDPARVLAEVEAKRKIIAFHDQWPVLVTTEPKIEFSGGDGIDAYTARMSQQIEWQTTQQYRARFGEEPPTAPMIRALAQVYAGHPDFEEEWRI